MSRCSKKCNEIKQKIDNISGLDDEYVYDWLKRLDNITEAITGIIKDYADRDELNGTCFKEKGLILMEDIRKCSHCGKEMKEGYVIAGGLEYYCSDECLHKHYTKEEWQEMYDDDGDNYWTEWEE